MSCQVSYMAYNQLIMFKRLKNQAPKGDQYRLIKFIGSLLIAILCVVLLSALSSCSSDDPTDFNEPELLGCLQENLENAEVRCDNLDQPVCGCDGVTYDNACQAVYDFGIARWTNGSCDPVPNCQEILPDTFACTLEYAPVCGCNGKTYPNPCVAEAHNIFRYSSGRCGTTALEICEGQTLTIGVEYNEEKNYVWQPSTIACNNCSQLEITPSESQYYQLQVYPKNTVQNNLDTIAPSAIYAYEIAVRDCVN